MLKCAIVTGAAGDLGSAVVNKFLAEHYAVVGTVRTNSTYSLPGLTQLNFSAAHVDLSSAQQAETWIKDLIAAKTVINVAVFTVGGFATGTLAHTGDADIKSQCNLNFFTAYNVARPVFLQMMKQGQGKMFFIGSRSGIYAAGGTAAVAYSIAKSMLAHFAGILREEAKGSQVEIYLIVPTIIDTRQNREAMPGADTSSWLSAGSIADRIYDTVVSETYPDGDFIIEL